MERLYNYREHLFRHLSPFASVHFTIVLTRVSAENIYHACFELFNPSGIEGRGLSIVLDLQPRNDIGMISTSREAH